MLFPDWLVDHYKFISKKLNISFSEMIRLGMCMHLGNIFKELYPNYKCEIDSKELAKAFKTLFQNKENKEYFAALKSKIYLEAKNAVKFRAKQT